MGNIAQSKQVFPDAVFPQGIITPFDAPFHVDDLIAKRYRVQGLLGHGGVGYVLAAFDQRTRRELALKFLRPELADRDDVVRWFRVEGMTHAKIHSPHVLSVEAVDELADGTPFMVMQKLQGRDLGQLLEQTGPLAIETAVDYVLQACEGLAAAHAAGVRHFDVKPANLFLVDEGEPSEHVELIDFGGAPGPSYALENVSSGDTLIGIGSPLYMSPEQERGTPRPDDRSDIWSLGCVLYELLAGAPVFARRAQDAVALDSIVVDEAALGPRLDCADIPHELDSIIRRCLQGDPADRYHDVAELAAALLPFAPESRWDTAERCFDLLRGRGAGDASRVTQPSGLSAARKTAPNVTAAPWGVQDSLFGLPAQGRMRTRVRVGAALVLGAALLGYGLYAADVQRGVLALASPVRGVARERALSLAEVSAAAQKAVLRPAQTTEQAPPANVSSASAKPEARLAPASAEPAAAGVNPSAVIASGDGAGPVAAQPPAPRKRNSPLPASVTRPRSSGARPSAPSAASAEPDVGF